MANKRHHRRRGPRRLAASQIAQMGYCEQKVVFDRVHGEVVTEKQQSSRKRGNQEHARFDQQAKQHHNAQRPEATGSKYCFIATQVYGGEHANTWQLRRFRDRQLRRSRAGRWLVARYYRHAPMVADWLEGKPALQAAVRQVLDGICKLLHPWTD